MIKLLKNKETLSDTKWIGFFLTDIKCKYNITIILHKHELQNQCIKIIYFQKINMQL